ncbi:hypothetical protein F6V25_09985 [Oryzomonas japonica]|uniref:Uncharacterized protein n=1 Tax=Oryzomonas japonica TaxID=2603858 RepID=A0A7J4ZQQ8_9BACT|nr:hypothetical protein [Oryzomonas japonica]KAB0665400.1 hypothetical protein F6V25_09985 [Oryzomonas japonica]
MFSNMPATSSPLLEGKAALLDKMLAALISAVQFSATTIRSHHTWAIFVRIAEFPSLSSLVAVYMGIVGYTRSEVISNPGFGK